jgi:murein L,D-transpeptidase YafK
VSLRAALMALLGLAIAAAAGFFAIDFFQMGRQAPPLAPPQQLADLIRVDKTSRTLTLLRGPAVIRTYPMSLGRAPSGHKLQEGDGRTPEGRYSIDSRNSRSRFHLALHISYPNGEDRAGAQRRGVSPGGDIMIHGLPNGISWLGKLHLQRDWTDGCIAVTNQEMDEIWSLVATGTQVEILP